MKRGVITSYAQNFEDVMLWRALGHIKKGRYLDIGAQDPIVDSVSKLFYDAGWRGIHVEATPAYATALRTARPNETVYQAAVTSEPGTLTFFEFPKTGLSTGQREIANHHRDEGFEASEISVPTMTLASVLNQFKGADIHWMKVDVEGMEADVLRSWNNSNAEPWVLIIESTFPNSQKKTDGEWRHLVENRGYREVFFDGLSRFFVSKKHRELEKAFESPPNVFDQFRVAEHHFAAHDILTKMKGREAELSADVESLKSGIEARATELERSESEREGLQQNLQSHVKSLAVSTAHASALAVRASELEVQAQKVEAELARKDAEIGELHINFANHRAELIKELAKEKAEGEAEYKDEIRRLVEARTQRETALQTTLGELTEALVGQTETAKAALMANAKLQADVRELDLQNIAHKTSSKNFENEIEKLRMSLRLEHEKSLKSSRDHVLSIETMKIDHERQMANQAAIALNRTKEHEAKEVELQKLFENFGQLAAFALDKAQERAVTLSTSVSALEQQIQEEREATCKAEQSALDAENLLGSVLQSRSWRFVHPFGLPRPITMTRERLLAQGNAKLSELLALEASLFVQSAYEAVLGRAADEAGFNYYLERLEKGVSRLEILGQLRKSVEGRARVQPFAGLDSEIRLHKWRKIPIIGQLFRKNA